MDIISRHQIVEALRLADFDPAPAQQLMAPVPRALRPSFDRFGRARQGAVMLLLYPGADGEISTLLTRRPETLNAHAGQIAFPGGRQDAGEALTQTALRETFEEVGVWPRQVDVLGALTTIYIPVTDYEVHPFVGWMPARPTFQPNTDEVAELIETPLSLLLAPETRVVETWQLRGFDVLVPFFQVGEHKVWGATAIILSEFVERLRTVRAT
ncbi:MAG: CoA pyrophosphatase, partial [Anaerolineales bacterium]|nr:CoA pyrophosphatase [Anaerolineales bacterium]